MTPQDFVRKWRESRLPERSGAQAHFLDLCALLGEKTPADLDAAVAAAYGWTDWGPGLSDEAILERLFKLNQERAATGR